MVVGASDVGVISSPVQLRVGDEVVLREASSLNVSDRTDAGHAICNAIAAVPEDVADTVRRLTRSLQTGSAGAAETAAGGAHQGIRDGHEVPVRKSRARGRAHPQLSTAESIDPVNQASRRAVGSGNAGQAQSHHNVISSFGLPPLRAASNAEKSSGL